MHAAPVPQAEHVLEFSLFVPITPKGQGRPRFDPRSGRAYTPAGTRAYIAALRTAAEVKWGAREALEGPLSVYVDASFSLPKRGGERRFHVQRPDADNIAKAALDALTGLVFADDTQVVDLSVRKGWSIEGASLRIKVWSLQ